MRDHVSVDVVVVGLGKIGLALAVQYASAGLTVLGADIDADVVARVNAGQEPFPGEYDLARRLRELAGAGLSATTDTTEAARGADTVVVVVPLVTDADGTPDFRALDATTAAVGAGIRPGTLVLYETTLPVGTTRTRFAPQLAGAHVAFSPERVLTGRVFADLRRYPKLIGGLDEPSARAAETFYTRALQFDERADLERPNGVWDLGTAEAAELAKLAETTYRDVNIGLANTFAMYAEKRGIDIHRVIEAANSQPFSHIHAPGISVGGHCIPIYPRLFLWDAPEAALVRAAREQNLAMPGHAVARLAALAGGLSGARVAVLGAAYRRGVKETAFSGVFDVVGQVRRHDGTPLVHDPLYSDDELRALGFEPYTLGTPVDAALVHTDHAMYAELTPRDLPGVRALFDGRGLTKADLWPEDVRVVIGAA